MSPLNSEAPAPELPAPRKYFALICLVLALGTVALYWPITNHPFIIFDDEQYISANPHVASGLSGTNFVWAFTTSEQANWHPLTWLTHQLDCTLFGLNAGAHHFVNLVYHVINTLLLFVFLRSATGAMWRSAFVAAFFAWHPMHVESVAWAAERKDVLSTFFWLLTLLAYLQYARQAGAVPQASPPASSGGVSPPESPGRAAAFYVAALIFCACGLMSKPMVVTLPCVLLLLDFWPLSRVSGLRLEVSNQCVRPCQPVSVIRLMLEKIPFFALVIAGSVVTFLVQAGGGAVSKIQIGERVANAALAYARYTAKIFWPTDLAIIYPHPRHWPLALAIGAMGVLLVWTILCVYNWRKCPFLAIGWFWFLGTLVPTIGIIQVGSQAMADRYTYIPSIGLFIAVVWSAAEFITTRHRGRLLVPALGAAALFGCLCDTSLQINYWRDSITLFRHAVEVTVDNYSAENVLGKAYEKAGDNGHALFLYQASVDTEARFPQSQFNLAMCLLTLGQKEAGIEHLKIAAALEPRDADIQYDLGIYFSQNSSWTNAVNCFSNSVLVRPEFAPAQLGLGSALANIGNAPEAVPHFREALRLNPGLAPAKTNLDRLLAGHPELR